MYHFIYITASPSFYKINLFNEINRKKKILVLFTHPPFSHRNADFYRGDKKFEYVNLFEYGYLLRKYKLASIIINTSYREIILGGWDSLELWISMLISPQKLNSVIIESSIFESNVSGLKGFAKKIFFSKISKVYASGDSQLKIAKALNFKGETVITKGVGLYNLVKTPEFVEKKQIFKFIYVGRLSIVKNLSLLISIFNEYNFLELHIVGFGPLEKELKSMAKKNIYFHGAIDNINLSDFYQNSDVFILPSLFEPWGMVVEEAFNNGLPVIVSSKVGCHSEIVTTDNGIVFDIDNLESLKQSIIKMTDVKFYNRLRKNVCNIDLKKVEDFQVNCYL